MSHELESHELRSRQYGILINGWSNAQKRLLDEQQREREKLLRGRESHEAGASVFILEQVSNLGKSGLHEKFQRLQKLENGIYENGVRLPLKPFFDVAEEIKVAKAETYVHSLFSSFRKMMGSKDEIILKHVFTSGKDGDKNILGSLHLAKNSKNNLVHIKFGFDALNLKYPNLDSVKIDSDIFLHDSFENNFDQLILSEKASVVTALFVATDRAVSEALDNCSKQS